ncbi:MAG: zinc ribbon domain-containing protein, partial [Myxococcota bacterium]
MFCQSCGAKNVDDARFCNMCGASLAKAGETGGPIVDAADTLRSDGTPPPAAAPPPSRTTGAFSDSLVGVSL